MKKHVMLCLSLCTLLSSHPAHAWDEYKDNPNIVPNISEYSLIDKNIKYDCPTCGKLPDGFLKNWEKDKAYLDNFDNIDLHNKETKIANCDLLYNILWQWSKKGNLNARSRIFISMAIAPMSGSAFLLPTTSSDRMTYMRQLALLAIYQVGSEEEKDNFIKETADSFITEFLDNRLGKNLVTCIQKNRSYRCVEEAVKEGAIPSFDRFAKEVDTIYAAGFPPICISGNSGDRLKPIEKEKSK